VLNGEPHSLARIPLRWMIRECFKVDSGIIFDSHMLKHETGLDIESTFDVPRPLLPETFHLIGPDGTELEGFSLRQIPATIISALGSPFRWTHGKLSQFRLHRPPRVVSSQQRPVSDGEAREEFDDARSPIYDQLKMHTKWKVMEYLPCKSPLYPNSSVSVAMSLYGASRGHKKARHHGG
jgi:hypothetical protein